MNLNGNRRPSGADASEGRTFFDTDGAAGFRRLSAILALIFSAVLTTAAQKTPAPIRFDGTTFRLVGWKVSSQVPSQGWASVLWVYAGAGDVPPLAGTYSVENGTLVFHPSYPIAPGVHYRAMCKTPSGVTVETDFDGPRRDVTPTARVLQVYPSADILPSNDLRVYIYFSAPMSRGEAARYLHVFDENGKDLTGPTAVFLPGEELWDPNFERLTMTFDPGRIKRGLTSNEKIGPPIAEGKHYALVIDRDWPDAKGAPLVAGFRKEYRGGPAQRTPPDPKQWRVTSPHATTLDPLTLDFPVPMSYTLLQRMIQVTAATGTIAGTVSVAKQEAEWRFTPREAWKAGAYQLVIDTNLEDLAGNHIGQPFDIDTFTQVTESIKTQTVSLPFSVR